MKRLALIGVAIVLAWGALACSKQPEAAKEKPAPTFDDVKKESREALKTIEGYTSDKLKNLPKELTAKLDEMEKKANALREKLAKEAAPTPENARAKLDELSAKIKAARDKIASTDFKATSAESWAQLKQVADTILTDLGKTYEDALDVIQQAPKKPKK